MKLKTYILIYGIIFLLQPLVASFLPNRMSIDPLLCITIAISITFREEHLIKPIVVVAFFTICKDLVFNQFIGVSLISLISVVFFVFFVRRIINTENLLTDALVCASSILIYNSIYWLIYSFLGTTYSYLYMLKRLPLSLAIEVIITEIMLYFLINKLVQARRDGYFR
ncbi:MAG: hypothetical protein SPI74_00270 [Eubacterium sp.]|nr:hypothetical protein [Eubacterium sp.]